MTVKCVEVDEAGKCWERWLLKAREAWCWQYEYLGSLGELEGGKNHLELLSKIW